MNHTDNITTSNTPPTADIVGAGIGGLTTAAGLARRGWRVRLHEREPEIRAFGSGIYIWGNGLSVLDELGVLGEATTHAHRGGSIQTRSDDDTLLSALPINGPGNAEVVTILRKDLIAALVSAVTTAGVEIVCGSTAVDVTEDGVLTFDDGSRSAGADLVILADGAGSQLRSSLGLKGSPRPLGQVCARAMIDRTGVLPDHDAEDYIEWYSGRRFLLYTPSSDTEAYIALVCPSEDFAAQGARFPKSEWIRSFPQAASFLERIELTPRWDPFTKLELDSWSRGKVAVLGDAAHSQPPYLGQGGGCAMTAAVTLVHSVTSGTGSLTDRLTTWESDVRPLIQHTQRFSFSVGQLNDVDPASRANIITRLAGTRDYGASRLRAALSEPALA